MNIYEIQLEGDELHDKLGGGLPKGALILIEAPNGLGKSILSQRFTYGLLQNGVTVSYCSTELPTNGFVAQMESVGYPVKHAFLTKKLKYVSLFSAFSHIEDFDNLIDDVLSHEPFMKSDVIILDALSDFLVNRDLDKKKSFDLIQQIKKVTLSDKTVIVTVDPDQINEHIHRMIQVSSTVYLEMKEVEQFGNTVNMLRIKRFNAAAGTLEKSMTFKVRPQIGIVVELASG